MITKKLWYEFSLAKLVEKPSIFYYNYTPSELAIYFIGCMLMTPFCIVLDLILLPIEILYYKVKKFYEKELGIKSPSKEIGKH